jgi:hypothetical protein
MPVKTANGRFVMNFGGKFTRVSIKNAILLDEHDKEALIVRKIGDNDLEIENFGDYSEIASFGFAIVSWLCPF